MGSKTPRGTTQAYMPEGELYYVIEQWDGFRWEVVDPGPFPTKRQADEYGFKTFSQHRK